MRTTRRKSRRRSPRRGRRSHGAAWWRCSSRTCFRARHCTVRRWAGRVRRRVFRVRQVELVGVRNLAPDAVIAALRLEPGASVFGDTRLLADRVRGLAGVAEARVVRHLPAALTVELREVEPAALTPGPRGTRLVAVDAAGHPLPFDPARSGLDLPIAASGDPGVVGVLALIQSVDPALFQTIT